MLHRLTPVHDQYTVRSQRDCLAVVLVPLLLGIVYLPSFHSQLFGNVCVPSLLLCHEFVFCGTLLTFVAGVACTGNCWRDSYFGSSSDGSATAANVAERGANGMLEYLISFATVVLSRFVDDADCVASASSFLEVRSTFSRCLVFTDVIVSVGV